MAATPPPGLLECEDQHVHRRAGPHAARPPESGRLDPLAPAQDQKVMVIGGGSPDLPTNTTAIIDLKKPSPSVRVRPADQCAEAVSQRSDPAGPHGAPDRTGQARSWAHHTEPDYPYVYSAQIYHPDTNTWQDAPNSTVGRGYHSEAILLPDGRVATIRQQLVRSELGRVGTADRDLQAGVLEQATTRHLRSLRHRPGAPRWHASTSRATSR